jgi:hypothetical protein
MEQNMDNSYQNPGGGRYPLMSKKTALLRLAVVVLGLLTTHVLLLRLHPFGAQRFLWNLVLGALSFWVVLRLAMPRLTDEPTKNQQ